jgi:beta-galactosidase
MLDLSQSTHGDLKKYSQVWAFCTDEMNARDQQAIIDYSKEGGNVVLFPYMPDRDLLQKPCSLIRDALSISPAGAEIIDSPLIDIYNLKDIKCANPQVYYSEKSLEGAEIIARTLTNKICGFRKDLGNGSILHLSTWIGFDTEGQLPVYEAFLNKSPAKLKQSSSNNYHISVRERFTANNAAMLFIGNYYNEEFSSIVSYTHPGTGETITIPYSKGECNWPALYAVLTPVCLEISDRLKILHSTSDILGIHKIDGGLELRLYGDRDLPGEIVLEGQQINRIKSVSLPGENIKFTAKQDRLVLNYNHTLQTELILTIKLS